VEFSLPYYRNFDATITPHYMNKRRRPMQLGSGLTEFDYLPSDKVYEDDTRATATAAAGCSTGTTPGYRSGMASER
jgi:lipopolysaccharide assembly outer membrane protein LptD (OstA)